MTSFAKLCALIAVIYLTCMIMFSIFKPMSGKRKKRTRNFIKNENSIKRKEKFIYFKDIILKKLSHKVLLSDVKKEEFSRMIRRLDMKISPEEIRMRQILYSAGAVLVSFIAVKINIILGFVSMMFVVLGWMYPVDEMEREIEKKNKNIILDFPAFYGMLYYQYIKSVNIFLADVVRDFIPNANEDMAEELGVLLDNIEFGEEFALKQLKKRVPVRHIIKFCDIMETRLKGYDNTSQMTYLKNELDELRVVALEDELKKREAKSSRIQILLIVVLAAYIIIYYYYQFIGAMKLFF